MGSEFSEANCSTALCATVKAGMVFKSIFDSGGIVSIGAMAVYL